MRLKSYSPLEKVLLGTKMDLREMDEWRNPSTGSYGGFGLRRVDITGEDNLIQKF